jgi:hypothetical protein
MTLTSTWGQKVSPLHFNTVGILIGPPPTGAHVRRRDVEFVRHGGRGALKDISEWEGEKQTADTCINLLSRRTKEELRAITSQMVSRE